MKYQAEWYQGSACGVFPNEFDTREEAQEFAENQVKEMNDEAGLDPTEDHEAYCVHMVFEVEG